MHIFFQISFVCQNSAIARSMHGVVLSRYAVRCPPPVLCWEMGIGIGLKYLHDIAIQKNGRVYSVYMHTCTVTHKAAPCLYAAFVYQATFNLARDMQGEPSTAFNLMEMGVPKALVAIVIWWQLYMS